MEIRKFFGKLGGGAAAALTMTAALPLRLLVAGVETGVEMSKGKSFDEAAKQSLDKANDDLNSVFEGAFELGQKVGEAIGPEAAAIATGAVVAHSLGKR